MRVDQNSQTRTSKYIPEIERNVEISNIVFIAPRCATTFEVKLAKASRTILLRLCKSLPGTEVIMADTRDDTGCAWGVL